MKCLKNNKSHKPSEAFVTSKKNFICSCLSKRGSKFDSDKVWLCMKSVLSSVELEMTENEALAVISVLTASLYSFNRLSEEVKKSEK